MLLVGLGSTNKDSASSGTVSNDVARKAAEGAKARQAAASSKLQALPANASVADVVALCKEMEQFGGVPNEHSERCGTAFFAQGKDAAVGGKNDEGVWLLKRAAQLSSTKKDEAAALLKKADQERLSKAAGDLLKDSQAKLAASDIDGAATSIKTAREKAGELRKLVPDNKVAGDLEAKIQAHAERVEKAQEKQAEAKRRERFIKESCSQIAKTFGPGSSLSDLQKEELWKKYEDKEFAWDLEVVEVSSGLLGGYTVQFKCGRGSPSLIQDLQMSYPERAKSLVIQFKKGAVYEIEGRLKTSSTLLGMTADPL